MFQSRVISRRDEMAPETYEWIASVSDRCFEYEDIDEFHHIFSLRDGVYNIFEESADGMGDIWLNLIVGPEKAMLIDTGFGIGNLKAIVDRITGDMPLIVANTHEHLDHVMGNYQFDSAYCHKYGVPRITEKMTPNVWDNLYDENGNGKWLKMKISDHLQYDVYKLIPCDEGHIFDLGGGHEIELIHTPGHAAGGASFLDKKNGILFTGAMHSNYIAMPMRPRKLPFGEYGTVEKFRDSLERLVTRVNEFDTIVPAHEILYLDSAFVEDQLHVCNVVLENPDDYDFIRVKETTGEQVRFKKYESAGIRYTV